MSTLLQKHRINYVLLRYPHLLQREILDLDLLVPDAQNYRYVQQLLKKKGYVLLEIEKYRSFWAKKEGKQLKIIDLYREVSWLGWMLLDAQKIIQRKVQQKESVCSPEDELLIYIGQAIFKNNALDEYKTSVMKKLMAQKLDWNYINSQLHSFGWKKPFYHVLQSLKSNKSIQFSRFFFIKNIVSTFSTKNTLQRCTLLPRFSRYIMKKIFLRRQSTICFLGPDGAGKSTLAQEMKKEYAAFFKKFDTKTEYVYFGWQPFLPTTKLISWLLQRQQYNIVSTLNKKKSHFSFFQEMLLLYYFTEYLLRYFFLIAGKKNKIIIFDRYFYDLYAHYNYAARSILFPALLRFFPRPDYTFVLDAPAAVLQKRKQDLTLEQQQQHQRCYSIVAEKMNFIMIQTDQRKENSIQLILDNSWRGIIKTIS